MSDATLSTLDVMRAIVADLQAFLPPPFHLTTTDTTVIICYADDELDSLYWFRESIVDSAHRLLHRLQDAIVLELHENWPPAAGGGSQLPLPAVSLVDGQLRLQYGTTNVSVQRIK